ncbi:TldD/PmbA family protein [Methanobacterium sp. SMA-27]|uniref:TldD/PmbA family protein n=1 Tax=Methanobacterium sp. SMA-27 TaxID=1495336 RepID=UPI00064F7CFE|nr:TldD/PmbA family protein [Methanobacterium sp. SMA-27]
MMHNIANQALDLALNYTDQAEIYVEKEEGVNVDIKKDKVDFAKEAFTFGLGVRVILDGRMGFSYTTNLDNIEPIVKSAMFNAKANEIDENFAFAPKSEYPNVKGIFDSKIEYLDLEDIIGFGNIMLDTVLDEKCEPTSGGFSTGYSKFIIANSEGTVAQDVSSIYSGYISVNVDDGENVSTASEYDASRYMDINPVQIAEKACKIAKDSRNGKPIETKDFPVILDHHAASGLVATFSSALNADNVQRGRSVFADKIGKEVVSSSLSIYDDGTLEGGLQSAVCDGEGTSSQKTPLIENGLLKNFMYDIYTSKKGGVESTGNGMRSSYGDVPAVGLSNFILEFGDIKDISEIDNGVLVTDILGAHTANPISGDFSVEAMNAFKIENGELKHPIKKAMLSGNIFQAMKTASAGSAEVRKIGPFVLPTILIENLRVVG